MKIAHITATFPPYEAGTGRVAYYNALELSRRGHDVTVITGDYPVGDYTDPPELHVQRLRSTLRIGNAPLLLDLLKLRGYDLIHLHYPFIFGAELVWWAARRANIPYVLTHHNDLLATNWRRLLFDPYTAIVAPRVIGAAKRFIAVSHDHAANCRLTPLLTHRWQDVIEVPNGVNVDALKPCESSAEIRQRHSIPIDATVIGFVGALDAAHPFKRFEFLQEAFAKLPARPDLWLLVVGDGDLKAGFIANGQRLGIADRTVFAGKVKHEELSPYYAALDMLVLPSTPPESFGMVLVEAGACERPVIASRIPGPRSVVQEGVTGLLFDPDSLNDLVKQISTLIEQPELRRQMGKAGYSRVHERHTWRAIAHQLEGIYQSVLGEKH